jgi:hypothetical protein
MGEYIQENAFLLFDSKIAIIYLYTVPLSKHYNLRFSRSLYISTKVVVRDYQWTWLQTISNGGLVQSRPMKLVIITRDQLRTDDCLLSC